MKFSELIWHNGEIMHESECRPCVASHSMQYGVAIFDGIMAYWNKDHYNIHYGDDHYSRFIESSIKLGFLPVYTSEALLQETFRLLEQHPPGKYYIRPFIYRSEQHIALSGGFSNDKENIDIMLLSLPEKKSPHSVSCVISTFQRLSARSIPVQWKVSAAYTNSFLARKEAENMGAHDGIMLNSDGFVCEASAANIFFIKGDILITPKINDDIFPGITRRIILDIAHRNKIAVEERDIHASEVPNFDGSFLCATLMEIVSVDKIGATSYNTNDIDLFKHIYNEFQNVILV